MLTPMTENPILSRLRQPARRTLTLLCFCLGLLTTATAAAQPSLLLPTVQASSEAQSSAAAAPLSAGELQAFADRLEDENERRKLIQALRALATLRDGSDTSPAEAEDPSSAIVDGVLTQMRKAGSAFAAIGALFSDLPALADWAQLQIEDPRRRALWTDVLLKLGATLLAALLLQALAYILIRRPLAALHAPRSGQGQRPSAWLQVLFAILRVLIGLVPIAVFAASAHGILAFLAPNALTRDLAQIVVFAFVGGRAIGIAAETLLTNGAVQNRLLRLDEESAHYALLWLRRLSAVAIYGYGVVRIVERVRVPPEAVDTLAKLIGFAFAGLLTVLVLQIRTPVAARIRGQQPSADAAATAPSQDAGVPETPQKSRTWRVLRQRIGDIWHVLAILYIAVSYAIWAFDVEGGFRVVLRGTLLTIAIIVLARALRFAAERAFGRLFAISRETRARFPGLEARANRYLPLLLSIIRSVIYVIAVFAILQSWGIDALGWLATETGRTVVARMVTILLVLMITVALWEATATGIEYYLTQPGPDGRPTPRSGRVRTLLPLLRRTVSIILGLIAGLIVLSELGINIAPLLAGAGVVGLAIGFGAQTLVKDIITGIFILTEDTVAVGDIVDLGGNAGVVEDISIRTIKLRDLDGIVHVIPYSEVTKIKNMTRGYAQAVFDINVSYREDPDHVIEVLKALAEEFRAEPEWNARILDPFEMWGVERLDTSGFVIRARFRTVPFQQWNVRREFQKRIKKRFDELGIEIPRPHRTIYFGTQKDGSAPPLRVLREREGEGEMAPGEGKPFGGPPGPEQA